ncbi:hypothetical protein AGIG_G4997 [Arapaima gigas]
MVFVENQVVSKQSDSVNVASTSLRHTLEQRDTFEHLKDKNAAPSPGGNLKTQKCCFGSKKKQQCKERCKNNKPSKLSAG